MDTGRWLSVLGGIITFAGTWWLSLFVVAGTNFVSAIPGILQFSNIVGGGAALLGVDQWVIYLILIVYSLYLLSFIAQLLGGKSRISAFIGSLIPLTLGVMLMIYSLSGSLGIIVNIMSLFAGPELVVGWIPFTYTIGAQFESIGTYAIIFGSLLVFISSFIRRSHED